MGPTTYCKYLVDAHKPAQDQADKFSLPQTVFYHPDYAFSCTEAGAKILMDKKTKPFVTWLPSNYFA